MTVLDRLQDQLDRSREAMLVAIEDLPDAALVAEGAVGQMTVAGLLALLTAWEAELVTCLMRLNQQKKPQKLLAALADREAYNQEVLKTNQGRDLDRIFDDFQHVRLQLETWLEEFSEQDLRNSKRYKWFKGKALQQIVAETTFELEQRYYPDVAAFARRWDDSAGYQPANVISLTAAVPEQNNDNDS